METTNKIIVIAFIFFLVGGLIGGIAGFSLGIKSVIKAGLSLLPIFTNISINEQAVNDALYKYKNNIKECIKT